jgi:hypothetical protein
MINNKGIIVIFSKQSYTYVFRLLTWYTYKKKERINWNLSSLNQILSDSYNLSRN